MIFALSGYRSCVSRSRLPNKRRSRIASRPPRPARESISSMRLGDYLRDALRDDARDGARRVSSEPDDDVRLRCLQGASRAGRAVGAVAEALEPRRASRPAHIVSYISSRFTLCAGILPAALRPISRGLGSSRLLAPIDARDLRFRYVCTRAGRSTPHECGQPATKF